MHRQPEPTPSALGQSLASQPAPASPFEDGNDDDTLGEHQVETHLHIQHQP